MLSVLAEYQREPIIANTNDGPGSPPIRPRLLYDAREMTVQQIADMAAARQPAAYVEMQK